MLGQLFALYFIMLGAAFAEIGNGIDASDGVLPKPVSYFSYPSDDEASTSETPPSPPMEGEKLGRRSQRFGTYGLDGGYGYGGVNNVGYYPFKMDLGGLLAGAVLGLGALFILPKVFAEFGANPYHGSFYGRSEESGDGLTQIMSRIDETLSRNNLNSTECLQKAVCSYYRSQGKNNRRSRDSKRDATRNYLMNFFMDGSKFKDAMENGEKGANCADLYTQCSFDQESLSNFLKNFMARKVSKNYE